MRAGRPGQIVVRRVCEDLTRERCGTHPLRRPSTCFARGTFSGSARAQRSRAGLRHGSGLTEAEWAIFGPFLPPQARCGRKRAYSMREVINAICHVLRGGVAWRLMPDAFPPWRTVCRWFARLRDDGIWETINHHLVMRDRERVGREASPTAAVIDSLQRHSIGWPMEPWPSPPKRRDDRERRRAGLRWRQEDQRAQAACDGGHRWPGAQTPGPCGRHSGSRRGRAVAAGIALALAVRATRLCRCRTKGLASRQPAQSGSRSCTNRNAKLGSLFTRGAGWSSASLPGSGETAAWPRTSRLQSPQQKHSSTPLPLSSCYDG